MLTRFGGQVAIRVVRSGERPGLRVGLGRRNASGVVGEGFVPLSVVDGTLLIGDVVGVAGGVAGGVGVGQEVTEVVVGGADIGGDGTRGVQGLSLIHISEPTRLGMSS